jgi:hypothetical protein
MPNKKPTPRLIVRASKMLLLAQIIVFAASTLERATTDATDRSIPRVRMTTVIPQESTKKMHVCTPILAQFSDVKKKGDRRLNTIQITTKTIKRPNCSLRRTCFNNLLILPILLLLGTISNPF